MISFINQLFDQCDIDCILIKLTYIAKKRKKINQHKHNKKQRKTTKNCEILAKKSKVLKKVKVDMIQVIYPISYILVHVAHIFVALIHQ